MMIQQSSWPTLILMREPSDNTHWAKTPVAGLHLSFSIGQLHGFRWKQCILSAYLPGVFYQHIYQVVMFGTNLWMWKPFPSTHPSHL